ncbi:MAG: AraC family transcriptional regulator [Sphingopyxis sp.]
MNGVNEIGLLARGATLGLLALWAWVMIRDHRSSLAARTALLFIVTVAGHILADLFPWIGADDRTWWLFILKLLQSLAPTAFWLFARTWFNDVEHISWRSWLVFALSALIGGVILVLLTDDSLPYVWPDLAQRLMWLGFALAGLVAAWKGRGIDLIEERRTLRTRFVWSVGVFVILVAASGFSTTLYGPNVLFRLTTIGIALLTGTLCATLVGIRRPEFLYAARQPSDKVERPHDAALTALAARIGAHVSEGKVWRDEQLTIAKLAAQLGEQEYRVRRAINQVMGHRNFAAFLNGYRLDEVRSALADPGQREVPILTIALDAGFGSLGPFNRAFREVEGVTPSAWRARALANFKNS